MSARIVEGHGSFPWLDEARAFLRDLAHCDEAEGKRRVLALTSDQYPSFVLAAVEMAPERVLPILMKELVKKGYRPIEDVVYEDGRRVERERWIRMPDLEA